MRYYRRIASVHFQSLFLLASLKFPNQTCLDELFQRISFPPMGLADVITGRLSNAVPCKGPGPAIIS
jgi:hypothetical protein